MLKIEKTEVGGWGAAIRGMRNPHNSWDSSDSYQAVDCEKCGIITQEGRCEPKKHDCSEFICYEIGPKDLALMRKLIQLGSDHRKFMRMIVVYADITAPLYWWKEYDTYKVGTVANSCSTMHSIADREFTLEDFSFEHLINEEPEDNIVYRSRLTILKFICQTLNHQRKAFLETNDKKYWWQMIQLLPSSYNQKRTVLLNYEVLRNMYHARKKHKLDEWQIDFCNWVETLPYYELITMEEGTWEL